MISKLSRRDSFTFNFPLFIFNSNFAPHFRRISAHYPLEIEETLYVSRQAGEEIRDQRTYFLFVGNKSLQ